MEFFMLLENLGANNVEPLTRVFKQGKENFLLLSETELEDWFENSREAEKPKRITDEAFRKLWAMKGRGRQKKGVLRNLLKQSIREAMDELDDSSTGSSITTPSESQLIPGQMAIAPTNIVNDLPLERGSGEQLNKRNVGVTNHDQVKRKKIA